MATVTQILDAIQGNLKLSGDVLVSINTTLTIANGLGQRIADAIERALSGDVSGLSIALTDINSSNLTLVEAISTLGKIKDVIQQTLPTVPAPEQPTEPTEPIPPVSEIPNIPLPNPDEDDEDTLPVDIQPTPENVGLPGSVNIELV